MKLHQFYLFLLAVSISYGLPVTPDILLKAASRLGGVVSSSAGSISSTSIPLAYKAARSHLLSASSRHFKVAEATEEFLSSKDWESFFPESTWKPSPDPFKFGQDRRS